MKNSNIEWCRHTFNPWIGCSKVSPGCANCYAEALMDKRWGKVEWGPNGTRQRTSAANWRQPLAWDRAAKAASERHRVFCASLADVGEDRPELVPWREALCDLIRATPNLDWLLLTKRPENMPRLFPADVLGRSWVGASVEDQQRADERIPHLLRTPAAVRFLSCEPLLGELNFSSFRTDRWTTINPLEGCGTSQRGICGQSSPNMTCGRIQWVIVGGESGPRARPCNVEWVRSIVRQCAEAGVACFVKQLGARPEEYWCASGKDCTHPDCGNKFPKLEDRKGGDPAEWPADLRVREFPQVAGVAGVKP